jgi:Fe-S cluster assembly ATP-binding protein
MLKIKNVSAQSDSNDALLTDINLHIKPGELHAIMGPKHSGKTALAHVITGHPGIAITDGSITFKKKKIINLEPDERSKLGIFVSMQYPPEYDGITNWEIMDEIFQVRQEVIQDLKLKYNTCCELLGLGEAHGERSPNGSEMLLGEAKRNELVHMMLLDPDLVLIDEIDDGLSESELMLVAAVLIDFLATSGKAGLIITHSKQLLDILKPTHVHVMVEGAIKVSGDTELYTRIVEDGYPEFS